VQGPLGEGDLLQPLVQGAQALQRRGRRGDARLDGVVEAVEAVALAARLAQLDLRQELGARGHGLALGMGM
jgi:hypothetical protein